MSDVPTLHVASFLVPSISVEFFEALVQYIERKLRCHTSLLYESRFEGPQAERQGIFVGSHAVDIAFMNANGFLNMRKAGSKDFELLTLATEHVNRRSDVGPAVFLDVVVNKNMKDMKNVHDLRGCRWAHNSCDRLTSAITLYQLKSMGASALFFSNVLKSRSHLDSLRMILQRKAHASAVDSNALQMFLRENPNERQELFTIARWGPLPPYAIVVRKTLDPKVRQELYHSLLTMHETPDGKEILDSFKVKRFSVVSESDLSTGEEYIEATKGLSFDTIYY